MAATIYPKEDSDKIRTGVGDRACRWNRHCAIDQRRSSVFGSVTMAPRKKKSPEGGNVGDRLSIRVDLASGTRIGPGKIAVLEEIARSGSISAAGRALKMSYRRTWELVEELNRGLGTPVVDTSAGGSGGGGAVLTKVGRTIVERYRAIELDAAEAARKHIQAMNRACMPK